ncbi:MAG TPA: type II secretion system protein [Desulfuromonadales bacterium]|nr:type II secretion system protein [Desulfuromonadales bacterium]
MKNSASNRGFTYLSALLMIMITGILLGAVGTSWKSVMQREREEELLFRGRQYKDAITRWYKPLPGQHVATPLRDLKDLLQDPRSLTTRRYLRRLYADPLTGKEWNVIVDPSKGITGVASTSTAAPLKITGFPDDLKELAGKAKYSEWLFIYNSGQQGVAGQLPVGLPFGMIR